MTNKEINEGIELLYALALELRSDINAIHTVLTTSDPQTITTLRKFIQDCRLNRSQAQTVDVRAQRHMIRLADRQRRKLGLTHQPRDKVMAVLGGPRQDNGPPPQQPNRLLKIATDTLTGDHHGSSNRRS